MLNNVFIKLKDKFTNSKEFFVNKVKDFFSKASRIDNEFYEELELLLVQADIGYSMSSRIIEKLKDYVNRNRVADTSLLFHVLKDIMEAQLTENHSELILNKGCLNVILILGVNGVGKTTTIGKLAHKLKTDGYNVIIGAGDTFRAAAIEQLEIWSEKVGVDLVKQKHGSDPAAVIYDTLKAAKSRGKNVAIIDTAGRLHNKEHLMNELAKIEKVIGKELNESDRFEKLLILDGTMGQSTVIQAEMFNDTVGISGIVLTKMDNTAKGGTIFMVVDKLNKPIRFIGVGESMDDLAIFNPKQFIDSIFS